MRHGKLRQICPYKQKTENSIYKQLLLNALQTISLKYGHNI